MPGDATWRGGTSGRRSLTVRAGAGSTAPERAVPWPPAVCSPEVTFRRAWGHRAIAHLVLVRSRTPSAFRAPQEAGRRSRDSARCGRSRAPDGCRAGARQRVWRGSSQEPRAPLCGRRPFAWPERWPGSAWGRLGEALGGVLPPKSLHCTFSTDCLILL